ncbi:WYL domain-containing protein [Paenibacillus sp.]|jgi:predicted DNA-binding transcriptional regulator YafY|uniref:helix-turn-helix transcriptional regulator n=1 Tax=Paenibacillus sp. TaxID=58172 RepID=UPI002834B234|nr:WYL domain-containing protein [Paenibacillus sp.]MDR0267535.1 WYL domain-containing protein [Paenibacillus sp.]
MKRKVARLKKMDRLMAIIMALQHGSQTASTLSEKLEVSRRTILRDVQILSEIGVPIGAASGPHGGYSLMEGFQLPPLQLSSREALCVLFALQGLMRYTDTPFNGERWTVMDKIRSILPEETGNSIEPLLDSMEFDVPKRVYHIPHLERMLKMTAQGKWLSVFYQSMNHRRRLLIKPLKIFAAHGFWYCDCISQTHRENRRLRIDRISDIVEAEEPLDFRELEPTHVQDTNIHIRAELTYKGMLQVERDEHIGECIEPAGDELWVADFHLPEKEWEWVVSLFFSLGREARVIKPEKLRAEIRQRASDLYNDYNHAIAEER